MARISPDTTAGAASPEVMKVRRLLKRLSDEHFCAWERLCIWNENGPDFWVLRSDGRSLLLKVSCATTNDARLSQQPGLLAALLRRHERQSDLGRQEQAAIEDFLGRLSAGPASDGFSHKIATAVLYPNIPTSILHKAGLRADGIRSICAGKDVLAPEAFEKWVDEQCGEPLSEAEIVTLRKAFVPEVVIPAEFTVRMPLDRNLAPQTAEYLLDYDQEWAFKVDLTLPEAAQGLARDLSVFLINGVAGCGKSLILVYRARLLRQLYPTKQILILTHNRPLVRDLESRYLRLSEGDQSVQWRTFYGWCYDHWMGKWTRPMSKARRNAVIDRVWHERLSNTSVTARMLQDEIDWYKDRLLQSRDVYLTADRTGRGFALNEAMRKRMYDAIAEYQHALDQTGEVDWGDIPRGLWDAIRQGKASLPRYDFILIDEAQFFAPIWFEIIKQALRPANGHLFLAADPKQGFLKRRQSWAAIGINVRNHSMRLDKSYRTTELILNFATLFYRDRIPSDYEESVAPRLDGMPLGVVPEIIPLTSQQDEVTRVVAEILRLHEQKVPLQHILVIHYTWEGVEQVLARLRKELGQQAAANPKDIPSGSHVRVCTLNAVTGLESPIVFLMGIHALHEEEQSLRVSDDERAELIRDNTRKLYMAMTRAGQRLVLTYVGDLPSMFSKLRQLPAMRSDSRMEENR